jgi:hypothetical protein
MPSSVVSRIVVCGPRNWDRPFYVFLVVAGLKIHYGSKITIVHGAARGVDTMAGEAAKRLGLDVDSHPADWKRWGKAAGMIRNRTMLDSNIDMVVGIGNGKGTNDCLFAACERFIPNTWRHH